VQESPSLHGPDAGEPPQIPVDVLHWSVVQTLPSSQFFIVPTHCPVVVLQVSLVVHRLPSSQEIGVVTGVFVHPVPTTHVSTVQALESLQTLLTGWKMQPTPAWQKSVVQAIPSLQTTAVLLPQTPLTLQVSPLVQGFPSSQGPVK